MLALGNRIPIGQTQKKREDLAFKMKMKTPITVKGVSCSIDLE